MAQTLFNKAVGGDTASPIFWMKARAGWRERTAQEHTGPNGEGVPCIRVVFGNEPIEEDRELRTGGRQLEAGSATLLLEQPDLEAALTMKGDGSA